jgi:ethanolamine phosphate phosphodiesterase
MAVWPNPALLILLVAALLAFEDWLTTPSCSGGTPEARASGDLRAMMVADLMLLGSDASYADHYFRDHLMSKFFTVSGQIQMRASQVSESCSMSYLSSSFFISF